MVSILYEDERLWLCVKPAGVLSEETPGQTSMPSLLRENGAPYVGVVHRLDRVTGGVMALAKTPAAAAKLSAAFAAGTPQKTYLAVIEGRPEAAEATWRDQLFFDRARGRSYIVSRPRRGTKEAVLDYRVLETVSTPKGDRTLVKVTLHTGRTHQIRAQFASRKLPLCGDGRYGGRDNGCTPALWCWRLSVEGVSASAPPPAAYPWSLFDRHVLKEEE